MLNLSFQVQGEKQLHRRLERIPASMNNWMGTFSGVGNYLTDFFSGKVFNTEGSVFGEPWAPLSPKTVEQKQKQGYPKKPLVRTGRMRKSFQSTATPKSVVVFNTTDYFKYHQSNKPRQKLPRRVMMKLDEMRRQIVVKKFHDEFMRRLKRTKGSEIY